MFACPAVKTVLCFSLLTYYATKYVCVLGGVAGGAGGVSVCQRRREKKGGRALMAMFGHKQLCLIIVFIFSFPVLMEVPVIQTGYNLSSLRRPAGPCDAARPWN